MNDKRIHKRIIKVPKVWNRADDNLVLLKRKRLCWRECSIEILMDLWQVQLPSVTSTVLSFPNSISSRGVFYQMLQGCSANEYNAALDPELCHPATGSLWHKPLPFLQEKSSPGLKVFAPGSVSTLSKCRDGDTSHFPHAAFRRGPQGRTNTRRPSGPKSSQQHCQVVFQLVKKIDSCVGWKQIMNSERQVSFATLHYF